MKMKTNDLIAMLSTNVERVDTRQVPRRIGMAVAAGAVAAIVAVFIVHGARGDLTGPSALTYLPLKLVFTMITVVLTSIALTKLARPGGERRTPIALVALPFVAIILLATISLASAPSAHWERMVVGNQWLECLISIPIIAVAPFAAIIWAVRAMAPTDLNRAGALAGLAAGAVSATAYAFHCMDDSLPFVALWYGGTIALCTLAGAVLGPRLLRW
jgi:hypothetical protein